MAGSRTPVAPSPVAPPRISLVSLARDVTSRSPGWERGFAYRAPSCNTGAVWDPANDETKPRSTSREEIAFEPFPIYVDDWCYFEIVGSEDEVQTRYETEVRNQLLAVQSYLIEQEFWAGDFAQATDSHGDARPNRYLAHLDSDVVTPSPQTAVAGLAAVEAGIAHYGRGQRGMVHAPVDVVTHWDDAGLVHRDGNVLLTVNDNIVVPGAGYDGSGPEGQPRLDGSVWVYGTSLVDIRLSQIMIVPDRFDQAFNRLTNTIDFRAERVAAATFDDCTHVAAELNLPTADIGGAGS